MPNTIHPLIGGPANYDPNSATAIVVYKPGSNSIPPMQNETTAQEENSKKACSHFIELWKQKHETGQWIEVEPEAISTRSEFPPFNASGIVLMGDNMKQNLESGSINGEPNGEDGAKADQKSSQQMGSHAAYPPWAMHPASGAVLYPPYPMQGMPFYPGVNPYYPPYPPVDDPSSGGGNSHGHKSHRKGKRSGKKPSVVVIKNVNVTSKKCGSSESESQSSSEVESADSDNSHSKSRERKHKSSCSKEGRRTTFDPGDEYNKDETSNGHGVEQGNWSAFQNFLLRAEEKTRSSDADLFAGEKEPPSRRKQNVNTADPIILVERDGGNVCEQNKIGFDSANGRTRVIRVMSNDELVMSGEGRIYMDCEMKEIEAGGGRYRRGTDVSFGYDPAMDYDSHMQSTVKVEDAKPEDVLPVTDGVQKVEKEKLKNARDGSDKRTKDSLLRRLSAPRTPLNDAQKRAQNLRAYKADLQKLKKEQEEEQIKRLERLKLDRQKWIAARGNGKGPGNDAPRANGMNGLSKSVPTFTGMKRVENGTTESLSGRLKRLSEPKSIVGAEHSLNPKSAGAGRSRRSMA
ncbi:COP1-interacting protein-related [Zea mays]|nr:COP1-interacting protein-related [Zea mays]